VGFLFLILYPAASSSSASSAASASSTIFHTQLCHTTLAHTNFVTHHLSYTIFVTHRLSHTTLTHTHHLSHTIFVTHHLSHTSLSTTIFHTLSFRHHLSHLATSRGVALGDNHLRFTWPAWHLVTSTFVLRCGSLRGRYGTWRHPPSFHVAGAALGDFHKMEAFVEYQTEPKTPS